MSPCARVDKREALRIFTQAFVRELLREDEDVVATSPPPDPDEGGPWVATPQFDFAAEPDPVPSDVELDDAVSEDASAAARAARRRAILEARQRERLFPEDLPMSGLGPPEDLP